MLSDVDLSRFSNRRLIFVLCLIVFLVYANSLFNDFVWDDWRQIVDNSVIHSLSNFPLLFKGSTFGSGREILTGLYYRPLFSSTLMVNFFFWKEHPFGFHLFQLLIHLGNVVLIFLIFKELFEKEGITSSNWVAFWPALVFGIHPANVEAVVYISATHEVLFSLFCLSALWLILKNNSHALWVSGALFFLALLSFEMAIAGGGVILLYLFLFKRKNFWQWLLVLGLAFGIYLWLRLGVAKMGFSRHGLEPIAKASFYERLLTVPLVFFSYLKLVFWPRVLAICRHFVVKEVSIRDFWLPLGIDLFFLGSFLFWAIKRGSRLFWFFSLWFLGSMIFLLNIIPLDMTVAERWLYFPLVGFLGGFSLVVSEILKKKKDIKKIFFYVLIVVLVGLGARTVKRNFDWQNSLRLLSHDIAYSQNSYDLENNLGVELLFEGEIDEAIIHLKRSIELEPRNYSSHNSLGYAWYLKGDYEKAEEILPESINLRDNYPAYKILALVYIKQGEYDQAEAVLEDVVSRFPKAPRIENIWMFLEEERQRSIH